VNTLLANPIESHGTPDPVRVGVFGIGNLLRSDDGFGPRVIRRIEETVDLPGHVRVADLGTPGLDLASYIAGLDLVVVIDTVMVDAMPGTLIRLTTADLDVPDATAGAARPRMTMHEASLTEALWLAELSGRPVGELVLIGVVPECLDQGVGLSARVDAALERAVAAVVQETDRGRPPQ
jgi:hydrogenase maturation protease